MSFILTKYMHQYNSMRTYDGIRDLLYVNQIQKAPAVNPETLPKKPVKVVRQQRKKTIKNDTNDESVMPEYNENVILAVNNDSNFGIIISNFRKQKSPMAHLYYNENISSLICFIKNPRGYPIIIITIPNDKTKQNIYINRAYTNNNMCYSLPLNDDVFKNITQGRLCNYNIVYSQNQGEIKFNYKARIGNSQPVEQIMNKIDEIDIKTQINTDFSMDVDSLALLLDDDNYNAFDQLNWMTLNIVCKQVEADTFNSTDTSKSKNIITLTANKELLYTVTTTIGNKRFVLCSGNDPANTIRWNLSFSGLEPDDEGNYNFELYEFTSMFKSSYNKILSGNVNVYYIFGQFHEDVYVFGKVTTTQNVDPSNINNYTLNGIFFDEFTTKEIYMCKTSNIFKH